MEKCRRRRVLKNKNTLYDSPLSIILFTVQLIDSIFICYLVCLLESERLLGGRAYMHAIAIGEHRSMSVERIIRDLTVYTYSTIVYRSIWLTSPQLCQTKSLSIVGTYFSGTNERSPTINNPITRILLLFLLCGNLIFSLETISVKTIQLSINVD